MLFRSIDRPDSDGDSTVISTLLLLGLPLSREYSFALFLNNQPRVRESPAEFESFRGSNFVLSVDGVLDEEGLAIVVDEDDEDDGDILDSGDFPGLLGRGAAIMPSGTGGVGAGLTLTLTGEGTSSFFFLKLQLLPVFSFVGVVLLSISKC